MDQSVSTRLKHFIEAKGVSLSVFADECGIPRPTLSQFLTGRNKKISDVMISSIHAKYPELNILWLLFGEGEMGAAFPAGANTGSSPADGSAGGVMGSDAAQEGHSGAYQGVEGNGYDGHGLLSDIPLGSADGGIFGGGASGSMPRSPLYTPGGVEGEDGMPPHVAEYEEEPIYHCGPGTVYTDYGSGSASSAVQSRNYEFNSKKIPTDQSGDRKYSTHTPLSHGVNASKIDVNQQIAYDLKIRDLERQIAEMRRNPRKVSHITIYYDDSTFETFVPKQ